MSFTACTRVPMAKGTRIHGRTDGRRTTDERTNRRRTTDQRRTKKIPKKNRTTKNWGQGTGARHGRCEGKARELLGARHGNDFKKDFGDISRPDRPQFYVQIDLNSTSRSTSILRPDRSQFYVQIDFNFASRSTSISRKLVRKKRAKYVEHP